MNWAREIVAKRALIVGAVGAIVHTGVVVGMLSADADSAVTLAVGGIIDSLALLTGVKWIRPAVTPADPAKDPMSTNGIALVELDSPA